MELSNYPRPLADNGRGIHWSPKQQNHGIHSWPVWENYLRRMRIAWVKVIASPDEDSVKIFRRLAAMQIMAVVRYVDKMPSTINASQLVHARRLLDEYGVYYVERVNEPDSDFEWGKKPSNWHLQAAGTIIADARKIQEQGQIPLLAMFNAPPGPNCIQLMLEVRGGREVLSAPCVLSIHNYGKGRPLEYPNDRVRMFGDALSPDEYLFSPLPPEYWTADQVRQYSWKSFSLDQVNDRRQTNANPLDNIMQNITNYRMFEYWASLWDAEGLPPCPIIGTESGWEVDDLQQEDHGVYPEPTADLHADYLVQQAQFQDGSHPLVLWNPDLSTRKLHCPDRYFTSMNWLVAESAMGEAGQWEQGAWVTHWHDAKYGLRGELPVVQRLQDTPDKIRQIGPAPEQWGKWAPWPGDWWGCDYDSRIDYIQPRIKITGLARSDVKLASQGAAGWYLKSFKVQYPDDQQRPFAPGYIFLKAYRDGQQVNNVKFQVDDIFLSAKASPDWTDFTMQAPRARHAVRVAGENSVIISGLGLGIENKPSWDRCTFIIEFEYRESRADMSWMTERIQMGLQAHKDGKIAIDEVQPYWDRAKAFDPEYSEPKATIRTPKLHSGQKYHKIIYIGVLPGSVNNGQHHAFIDYVDKGGARIRDPHKRLKWGWAGMSLEEFFATGAIVVDKPDNEFGGNIALNAGQQAIVCAGPGLTDDPFLDGLPAEWVEGVHTAFPDLEPGNTRFHTSTFIVYTGAVWQGEAARVYQINAIATPPDGGQVSGGGEYEEGQIAQLEAAPNRGYRFVGWFENGALVSQIPAMGFTVLANRNLEARFERQTEQPEIPTLSAQSRTEVSFNKLDLQAAIDSAEGGVVTIAFES